MEQIKLCFYRVDHEDIITAKKAGAVYVMASDFSMGSTALWDTMDAIGALSHCLGEKDFVTCITNSDESLFVEICHLSLLEFDSPEEFWNDAVVKANTVRF